MSKKNGLTLRITGPDGQVIESTSDQESIILGSGAGAAVRLPDPKVSNLHVMLKVDGDGAVTAIDLGSETGTRVGANAMRITQPVALTHGDVLHVGASQVRVLFGGAEEPRGTPTTIAASTAASKATPATPAQPFARTEAAAGPLHGPTPRTPAGPPVHNGTGHTGNTLRPTATRAPLGPVGASATAVQTTLTPEVQAKPPAPVRPLTPAPTATRSAQATVRRQAPIRFDDPMPAGAEPTDKERVLQVALLWGQDTLLDVQHFRDGKPVRIGEGKGVEFPVYATGLGEQHTLVENKGSQATLHVPSAAKARLARQAGGAVQPASGTVELGLHDRAEVRLDAMTLVVRYVRPGDAITGGALKDADFTFFKIASVALMVFFALVAAVLLSPPPDNTLSDDIFRNKAEYARLVIKPQKVIDLQQLKKAQQKAGADEGAKAKDEEGKFGKKDADKPQAEASKKGAPIVDKNKREDDRKKVAQAGLLGALGGGAASDVFGPGGLGTGINSALGGLTGGQGVGDAQGVGGLGARGSGTGGGGTGLGLGGLGTKGTGRGGPGGGGGLGLGGKGKEITKIIPGKTTVVGGLDKDVIAQVIRRHQNEIKFCYEKELQKNPNLGGKVAVAWTIEASGEVSDATVSESTMGNPAVDECIVQRIRRWKFPQAQNGGSTVVTFPWVFKQAGDE